MLLIPSPSSCPATSLRAPRRRGPCADAGSLRSSVPVSDACSPVSSQRRAQRRCPAEPTTPVLVDTIDPLIALDDDDDDERDDVRCQCHPGPSPPADPISSSLPARANLPGHLPSSEPPQIITKQRQTPLTPHHAACSLPNPARFFSSPSTGRAVGAARTHGWLSAPLFHFSCRDWRV